MRRVWTGRSSFGRLEAGLLAVALLLAPGVFVPGCARKSETPSGIAADTLANGLPRALVPQLDAWAACWREAIPGFAADSLVFVGRWPFTLEAGHPREARAYRESVQPKALLLAFSPDSSRALDFDRYLGFDDGEGGYGIEREPDSSPMLLDFASDSLWTVDFCGTSCFYDGGFWVDDERFALTGASRGGEQLDGPWQVFLQIRDLRTRQTRSWQSGPVGDEAVARYQAAYDAMLVARIHATARGLRASKTAAGSAAIAR